MALILITGAATGLGLATAHALVADGHEVVIHARNPSRLTDGAVAGMRGVITGDLADQDQTRGVAEQANAVGRFDVVIHNAGVLASPEVYAVNVIAPYLLTTLIGPPQRSLVLSSSMHRSGETDLDVLTTPGAGTHPRAYDTSKLLVTTLTMALARRRPEELWHAVDPGWVPTKMGGPDASDDLAEGHRTQHWLATAAVEEITPRTGGYWHHRHTRRPHPAALDADFQTSLLSRLAGITGVTLP